MLLSELFKTLSFNELSNLSIGNEGKGSIKPEQYERFIDFTNNALLELYSRFAINTKELILQTYDYKSIYPIKSEFALSNTSSNQIKYIIDTPNDPFIDDIISITGVRNEVGNALPINDPEQWASVFTPQVDTLQLTHVSDSQVFFVEYKAKPTKLIYNPNDLDATLNQEFILPTALYEALRYRVANYFISPMTGQGIQAKTQQLDQLYQDKCNEIEQLGLMGYNEFSTNTKLYRRGFI